MIRINQLKLPPDHTREELTGAIAKRLRLQGDGTDTFTYTILRQSIDARKKPDIFYVYTVDVRVRGEGQLLKRLARERKDKDIIRVEVQPYRFPHLSTGKMDGSEEEEKQDKHDNSNSQNSQNNEIARPIIIGSGPAGLFCALMLAREGLKPLVIERGEAVEERTRTVRKFWDTNMLDLDSNVQFGEGGAGTFSDGKLNTSIKDPSGRVRFVLQTFVDAGADEDILYSYKPHIGTDRLRGVIRNIREEIISLGGTFLFSHRLEELERIDGMEKGTEEERVAEELAAETAREIYALTVRDLKTGEEKQFQTDTLVLALGHSARDTFEMLLEQGVAMQPKAFAVGVRTQHPQKLVDDAMYGADCRYEMPPSPYKLTCQLEKGGVYSFCMCPGGYVVNASSEAGMIAVNGMSLHDRDSGNANAAIVMTVTPEQYAAYLGQFSYAEDIVEKAEYYEKSEGGVVRHGDEKKTPAFDLAYSYTANPLIGMSFSRMLEQRAYEAGGGCIPTQRFGDYCESKNSLQTWEADFLPRIEGRYTWADLRGIFPKEIGDGLEEAIKRFDRVIPGFASAEAVLCAPESRTSSPVRILRDKETFESVSHPGIYPCGEGAGYAGGITSAAIDGIRVAEAIVEKVGK